MKYFFFRRGGNKPSEGAYTKYVTELWRNFQRRIKEKDKPHLAEYCASRYGIKYPYPCTPISSFGTNLSAAPFMQYLSPPLSLGPSSNTCPKCESDIAVLTSVRTMPCDRSDFSAIRLASIGFVKLGQPQPASNLSYELKSG